MTKGIALFWVLANLGELPKLVAVPGQNGVQETFHDGKLSPTRNGPKGEKTDQRNARGSPGEAAMPATLLPRPAARAGPGQSEGPLPGRT